MNNAYNEYLTKALDEYQPNQADRTTIQQFLNWLNNHPNTDTNHAPSIYQYAVSENIYPSGPFLSKDILPDYGIDPQQLTDEQANQFIAEWADRIYDYVDGSNGQLCEDMLYETAEQLGIAIGEVDDEDDPDVMYQ